MANSTAVLFRNSTPLSRWTARFRTLSHHFFHSGPTLGKLHDPKDETGPAPGWSAGEKPKTAMTSQNIAGEIFHAGLIGG
jgi:hypothetical protein